MTYHQLCSHTTGLQQLVVNGEYKTVLNDYIISQSLQRAFLFSLFCRGQSQKCEFLTMKTAGGLLRTNTNSDAKEFLFSLSGHQNHRKPSNDHPVCIKSGQEQSKNQ